MTPTLMMLCKGIIIRGGIGVIRCADDAGVMKRRALRQKVVDGFAGGDGASQSLVGVATPQILPDFDEGIKSVANEAAAQQQIQAQRRDDEDEFGLEIQIADVAESRQLFAVDATHREDDDGHDGR